MKKDFKVFYHFKVIAGVFQKAAEIKEDNDLVF